MRLRTERGDTSSTRIGDRRVDVAHRLADPCQPHRSGVVVDRIEQRISAGEQDSSIGRQQPDGVERRRQRQHAGDVDRAVRRTPADDAAVAGRDADRAAGVGPERQLDQAGGDSGRRPGRRTARDVLRRPHVAWRAEVHVGARQRVGELIGDRLADDGGAGGDQPLHGHRAGRRRRPTGGERRVAGARDRAGHVEHVLHRQARRRRAGRRAPRRRARTVRRRRRRPCRRGSRRSPRRR